MDKEIELWLHDMVAAIGWFVGNMKRGDALRLISRHSEITERSQPGTIFTTCNYPETPVNLLALDALDRLSRTPEYKLCAIRVEVVR
jgi:predicted molibdopterin-dependent oxidoreductase YjgC